MKHISVWKWFAFHAFLRLSLLAEMGQRALRRSATVAIQISCNRNVIPSCNHSNRTVHLLCIFLVVVWYTSILFPCSSYRQPPVGCMMVNISFFFLLQMVVDSYSFNLHGSGDRNSSECSHRTAQLYLQWGKENGQTAICCWYHEDCHSFGVQQICKLGR